MIMPQLVHANMNPILRAIVEDRDDFDLGEFDAVLIQRAIDIGLGPLLYRITRQKERGVWQDALRAQELATRVESLVRLDALEELLANCPQELSVHVVLLKGISLCQRIYPAAHLRMMGDIDLLVPAGLQGEMETVLRRLGYVQRSTQLPEFYARHHHSMPFVHPGQNVVVEVHTGLFPPGTQLADARLFKPESFLGRCLPDEFRGYRVQRLDAETELAYLAAHWIAERRCFGTAMIPIIDLAIMLRRHSSNLGWDRLLGDLARSPAAPHVRVALSFLHDRLGIRLPDSVRLQLNELNYPPGAIVDTWMHHMIERHVIGGQPFGSFWTKNMAITAWDALLSPRSGWLNILFLPWFLVFPPGYSQRYNPAFQLRRLKSALHRKNGGGAESSD